MIRTLPGERWTCHGCSRCCSSGFGLGPVDAPAIERLRASEPATWHPPAADGWEDPHPEGVFLRQIDGSCVFLLADGRCAVHATLGASAKPAFCQEFPYRFVEDDLGYTAVIRAACSSFWRTGDGGVVADEAEQVRALPRAYPLRKFTTDRIEVLSGCSLERAAFLAGEPARLSTLTTGTFPERLSRLVDHLLREVALPRPPVPSQAAERAFTALQAVFGATLQQAAQSSGGSTPQRAMIRRLSQVMPGEYPWHQDLSPAVAEVGARWVGSTLLDRSFLAAGGLLPALGAASFALGLATRADPTGGADFGGIVADWDHLTSVPSVQALLRRAAPATRDLALALGAPGSDVG